MKISAVACTLLGAPNDFEFVIAIPKTIANETTAANTILGLLLFKSRITPPSTSLGMVSPPLANLGVKSTDLRAGSSANACEPSPGSFPIQRIHAARRTAARIVSGRRPCPAGPTTVLCIRIARPSAYVQILDKELISHHSSTCNRVNPQATSDGGVRVLHGPQRSPHYLFR